MIQQHWLLVQQIAPLQQTLSTLQNAVGTGEGAGLQSVDARARLIMGQDYPMLDDGQVWPMSCRNNYFAIAALQVQVQALADTLTARFAEFAPRLDLVQTQLTSVQAQQRADELADQALQAYAQATDAKATEAQARAAEALAKTQLNTAAEASLAAQLGKDEQAIAEARARAEAAFALATSATNTAAAAGTQSANAQASATQAISTAAGAQTTATAAQAAVVALAARTRTKRISTPGMAVGATATIKVTWDTPFADSNYTLSAPALVGGTLLGLAASITAQTAADCTVQIKNVLGLVIAAGAGILEVTAVHDAV